MSDAWARALDWALGALVHELANIASGLTLLTEDLPIATDDERKELAERSAITSSALGMIIDDARAILATEVQTQCEAAVSIARADRIVRPATRRAVVMELVPHDVLLVRASSRALSRAMIVVLHGLVGAGPRGGPRPTLRVEAEGHDRVVRIVFSVPGLPATGAEAGAAAAAALLEGASAKVERTGDRTAITLDLPRV